MLVRNIQNYNNTYNPKPKLNAHQISFFGAKEDFGKMLTQDIFQKENTQLTKESYKSIISNFKEAITDIISFENLIGAGFHGRVYQIDKNFVIKVDKNYTAPKTVENTDIHKINEQFSDLKTYYGEPVLTIGKYEILKNTGEHIPVGVPDRKIDELELYTEDKLLEYYQNVYLPTFAQIPQESYDAIVKDMAKLNRLTSPNGKHYEFDYCNPQNLVLAKDNKLCFVDDIDETELVNNNNVAKLLRVLLTKINLTTPVFDFGESKDKAQEILYKVFTAAEKSHLPYYNEDDDIMLFDRIFTNADIIIPFFKFASDIQCIKMTHFANQQEKVQEYLQNTFM